MISPELWWVAICPISVSHDIEPYLDCQIDKNVCIFHIYDVVNKQNLCKLKGGDNCCKPNIPHKTFSICTKMMFIYIHFKEIAGMISPAQQIKCDLYLITFLSPTLTYHTPSWFTMLLFTAMNTKLHNVHRAKDKEMTFIIFRAKILYHLCPIADCGICNKSGYHTLYSMCYSPYTCHDNDNEYVCGHCGHIMYHIINMLQALWIITDIAISIEIEILGNWAHDSR